MHTRHTGRGAPRTAVILSNENLIQRAGTKAGPYEVQGTKHYVIHYVMLARSDSDIVGKIKFSDVTPSEPTSKSAR